MYAWKGSLGARKWWWQSTIVAGSGAMNSWTTRTRAVQNSARRARRYCLIKCIS